MKLITEENPHIIDPSELLRPEINFSEKCASKFRDYTIDQNDELKERVRQTYRKMHLNQTVDFVKKSQEKWLKFDHCKLTIREALEKLNDLIDESDPDTTMPNIVHAFQTAERARSEFPQYDWLHLTGLIHDLGKIMCFYDEEQWSVVGDTFVVGCKWSDNIVYRDTSFEGNPDGDNPKYNTKYGMYRKNIGLQNLTLSWGHDEYMHQVLKNHKSTLPPQALNIIRYHSFYPWHSSGDYEYLMVDDDTEIKNWVLAFNCFDLYTKSEAHPDIDSLWPYYESLIEKYIPGIVSW